MRQLLELVGVASSVKQWLFEGGPRWAGVVLVLKAATGRWDGDRPVRPGTLVSRIETGESCSSAGPARAEMRQFQHAVASMGLSDFGAGGRGYGFSHVRVFRVLCRTTFGQFV